MEKINGQSAKNGVVLDTTSNEKKKKKKKKKKNLKYHLRRDCKKTLLYL